MTADAAAPRGGEAPLYLLRRAAKALMALCLAYATLAATHGGEFWPFSVFPMFSVAGRPWARALVRRHEGTRLEASYSLEALPGAPFALTDHGIPQNDLSSLTQRAGRWGPAELEALSQLFGSLPCEHPLLVLRVRGTLAESAIEQVATPLAWLTCDGTQVKARAATSPSAGSVE